MMNNTLTSARPEERFISAFTLQDGRALNGHNARLHTLRREAIASFAKIGLPTRKTEAWKYTPIERILERDYRLFAEPFNPAPEQVGRHLVPGLDAFVVAVAGGRFAPELSQLDGVPDGVVVSGLKAAAEHHIALFDQHFGRYADANSEPFTALNTAFTQDGVFVHVPAGVVLERPIHIVRLAGGAEDALIQPRSLVVVERGAAVRLIETAHSAGMARTFTNAVTEVFVGAGANLEFYRVQDEGANASGVDRVAVYQQQDSVTTTVTVTLSGEMLRNNVSVLPDGEHAEAHLYGLFLGKERLHIDNHTFIDHAKPACTSNELYKGVLDDASTGVFNGKVYVRQDAQQTNAYQSNKSVVLTPEAQMYSKPELEIYADDVKCSHGATTGRLDETALFYLRARGIPERQARAMLLLAFARDVTDNVRIEPLREMLAATLEDRFHD